MYMYMYMYVACIQEYIHVAVLFIVTYIVQLCIMFILFYQTKGRTTGLGSNTTTERYTCTCMLIHDITCTWTFAIVQSIANNFCFI